MQLRTTRFRRGLRYPAQCNSLTHCWPVYVPIVAGHSYATTRSNTEKHVRRVDQDVGALVFRRDLKKSVEPYTMEDVPPLGNLGVMLRHPAAPPYLKGMTAMQARALLVEFEQRRIMRLEARRTAQQGLVTEYNLRPPPEAKHWPWVLQGLQRHDPANKPAVLATLHSLACILLFTPGMRTFAMSGSILRDLGFFERYAPSDLTLVRLGLSGGRLGRPLYAGALDRVTTGAVLCETDSDRANYLTLRGLLCRSGAKTEKTARDALWWFQQALDPQKGRRTPGAFDWQATCMVEMGRCYRQVGDENKALQMWEMAARELDNPQATNLFANAAMDKRDPETEEWLTRAAMAGDRTAQKGLAKVQKAKWQDAKAQGVKGWELRFRELMKDEWETLSKSMPQ